MTTRLRRYFAFALLYILVQAVGMTIMFHGLGIRYGSPEMTPVVLWFEVLLALLVVLYVRRFNSWREIGYGECRWGRLLWVVPILLLNLVSLGSVVATVAGAGLGPGDVGRLAVTAVMTLLVGFAEETTFRGILLRGALERHGLVAALLVSAAGFSLLHSINVLGGETP
jgi:hypothetical protein